MWIFKNRRDSRNLQLFVMLSARLFWIHCSFVKLDLDRLLNRDLQAVKIFLCVSGRSLCFHLNILFMILVW